MTEGGDVETKEAANNQKKSTSDQPDRGDESKSLSPCSLCGRKFQTDRLDKHIQICQKIKERKRKTFDSVKQRAENLDKINNFPTEITLVSYTEPKNEKPTAVKGTKGGKSTWREQHQEFIKTIRAARGEQVPKDDSSDAVVANGNEDNSTSRSKSLPPGFVECPTCSRRFSERAADRHINYCAQKSLNEQHKQITMSNGNGRNQEAMERMKARTKYKPPPVNSLPVTRSTRAKPNSSPNPPQSRNPRTPPAQPSKTTSINRKYSRNISKSTENLGSYNTSKVTTNGANRNYKGRGGSDVSRSPTRTDYNSSRASRRDTERTIVIRKMNNNSRADNVSRTSNYGMKHVSAKINTGLNNANHEQRSGKKSAPVMKFKEKFPNHQHTKLIQADFETILRRNSTEIFDDSPKTVPGVRTGGISPVKNGFNEIDKSNTMSRSETNLNQIDNIKKRIDMYISGLYENQVWTNYSDYDSGKRKGSKTHLHTEDLEEEVEDELLKRENLSGRSHPPLLTRENSANSDEARGSTSDSTDSGLGVAYISNGINGNMLETVIEDGRNSKDRHDFCSPPMSDVERNSGILLRNNSLNDLHLLNGNKHTIPPEPEEMAYFMNSNSKLNSESTNELPRFCHQCGTKYPNTLAKFCYECGRKRFGTAS